MKNIIVTGAAKGLGQSIARDLIGHGFGVIALDIDESLLSTLKKDLGQNVITRQVDVTDEKSIAKFFTHDECKNAYALINNAGIYLGKSILDYTSEEIGKVVTTNLIGAINCTKYFAKNLLATKREGIIINMSSSSIYGGSDAVYSSTKAALVGLTKSSALKFSPFIRVNAVAPGIVDTDILKQIPKEVIDWYRKTELVKKPLVPQDVASTVRFLLSEDSKNYSGAVFDLNNGFHL